MKTELIEFKNHKDEVLRGILVGGDSEEREGAILLPGFEEAGTSQTKFKLFSDELKKNEVPSFRFDYSGTGLSDGSFEDMSVDKWTKEFKMAVYAFKQVSDVEDVSIVAHSLSACVVASYLENQGEAPKTVLLAPALNQRKLLRYFFAVEKSEGEANWSDFEEYVKEEEFKDYCEKSEKIIGEHYLGEKYHMENKDKNYTPLLKEFDSKILHIHGKDDDSVPLESIEFEFSNTMLVENGDHHLERPDMREQWLGDAVKFVIGK